MAAVLGGAAVHEQYTHLQYACQLLLGHQGVQVGGAEVPAVQAVQTVHIMSAPMWEGVDLAQPGYVAEAGELAHVESNRVC